MKIKPNYVLIPLIVIAVALLGSYLTQSGMEWYNANIIKPDLTPPSIAFPIAWNLIFATATLSALLIWNKTKSKLIAGLFIANAILNVAWSLLFFNQRLILASLIEMVALELTTAALIVLSWKKSPLASLLLLPYLLWVALATYLTYMIYILN